MVFSKWKQIENYPAVNGRATLQEDVFEACLQSDHYSLVRACAAAEGFEENTVYMLDYVCRADPGVSCQIAYTWKAADGRLLFRSHGVRGEKIVSPGEACAMEVDVCFYGYAGGRGRISGLSIEKVGAYRPRTVRLAAIMVAGDEEPSRSYNISLCSRRIDAAAAEGADLVLLPETYNTRGIPGLSPTEGAASLEDPAVAMLRSKAREHRIFTAASVRLKDAQGLLSNTIVLFDREGRLIWTYSKCHLTMGEIWNGMVPGREISTVDTELGRIGGAICWDRFMPEHCRVLFMKGTDIILNPTASGAYPLKEAHNGYCNQAFIVTAQTTADPELTRITGRNGQVLAVADPRKGYAIAQVDVNAYDTVFWLSAPDADTDPRSVYRNERRPELYSALVQEQPGN